MGYELTQLVLAVAALASLRWVPAWSRRIPILVGLAMVMALLAPAELSKASASTPVVVGAAASPTGGGWYVYDNGVVKSYGGTPLFGSLSGVALARPIVGMAATADGRGYWLVGSDGGIFTFGDATFYGSTGYIHLNRPIVGMAATHDGKGYWLVASDGGIFSYGDAHFYGSTGAIHLNKPIVGMASTPDSKGYWFVASDGGIFSYGDAHFYGSTGNLTLVRPVVGMASSSDGKGYWLVASDGGIFTYGDAVFAGSPAGSGASAAIVSAPGEYYVVSSTGRWDGYSLTRASSPPTGSTKSTTIAPGTGATASIPRQLSTATTPAVPSTSATPPPSNAIKVVGNHLETASGTPVRLIGVNLDGTQSACVDGSGPSWGPLDSAEVTAIKAWGANAVRVPLNEDCWLGINGEPATFSVTNYKRDIVKWVQELNSAGLVAILDLHWSAPGSTQASQEWPMPDEDHSVDFWNEVAGTFATTPGVMFDLFNEPYLGLSHPSDDDWNCWRNGCTEAFQVCHSVSGQSSRSCTTATYLAAGMQELVNAVRAAGAHQVILLGGLNWSEDPCGSQDSSAAGSCMSIADEPTDPLGQIALSFHGYNGGACSTAYCWSHNVLVAAASKPIVVSEFGETDCSATFVNQFMAWADAQGLSYLAWSWNIPPPGLTCSENNTHLIGNWNGTPSDSSLAGRAIANHFSTLSATKFPGGI